MDNDQQPITNVSKGTWQYMGKHWQATTSCALVAVTAAVIAIFGNAPQLFGVTIVVLAMGYSVANLLVETEFIKQFAAANGYTFSPTGTLAEMNGALFRAGHSQRIFNVVGGTYQGYPIQLFLYSYVIGYGRGSHAITYSVFRLQFDTEMPDLFLEQKEYPVEGLALSGAGEGKEFISLEGDFNQYFKLSIPKGYEVEALEVFTPDVMATLIDKCKFLNLEIAGTNLFVYSPGAVGREDILIKLYGVAQYFAQELGPVLARMKPSLVAEEGVMQTPTSA